MYIIDDSSNPSYIVRELSTILVDRWTLKSDNLFSSINDVNGSQISYPAVCDRRTKHVGNWPRLRVQRTLTDLESARCRVTLGRIHAVNYVGLAR